MYRNHLLCKTILFFLTGLLLYVLIKSSHLVDFLDEETELVYDDTKVVHDDDFYPPPVYLDREKETKYPIIVWWTPFTPFKREVKDCPLGTCIFTHSRTEYDNPLTEGFMFYGSSIQWSDLPLPRTEAHKWFLLHEESPKNDFILRSEDGISLFNYTATFSRHSSYPLVTQDLESIEWLLDPIIYPTSQKSKGDIGLVMYIHSDCEVPSDRDTYAEELMKYVKVDSYGKCVHNKDLPEHLRDPVGGMDSPDLIKIQGQYKFVLAFENAIADDYITEKLWRTFKAGSVPVYKGSPTVLDWVPSDDSVILVDDFSSPEELSKYLIHLDNNDDEYEQYLSYKKNGVTNERLLDHMKKRPFATSYENMQKPDMIDGFQCFVCDKMHERRARIENGETLLPVIADKSHYFSYPPGPAIDISLFPDKKSYPSYDSLRDWMFFYKCAEHEAKAIKTAISEGAKKDEIGNIVDGYCNVKIDW